MRPKAGAAAGGSEVVVETFPAHERFKGFRVRTGALRAELIELGGIVTRLEVPDRHGNWGNVLLGCPTIADYLGFHPHFNCLVGRYANRMTNARFRLDGREYVLDANIPPHHLHGGSKGFGSRLWRGEALANGVTFRLLSADGDCGYPGRLSVQASYRFRKATVALTMQATTDAPTPVSLTSHHYYNLSGRVGTVADHEVAIAADAFLPVDGQLTQMGELRPLAGTPFDLREGRVLGEAMAAPDAQMRLAGGGYDHTFVLAGDGFRQAAVVYHPASGRKLTVSTDQPGVQFYTCNTLHQAGRHGRRYPQFGGLCLETQQFPDAPNQPAYPSAIVRPGQTFLARTAFEFSVE